MPSKIRIALLTPMTLRRSFSAQMQVGSLPERHASDLQDDETRTIRFIIVDFVAIVLTQKVAVPLGSADNQIAFALIIHYVLLAFLLVTGRARIDMRRLVLFCALATSAVLTQTSKFSGGFSVPSIALMLLISSVLVIVVPLHRESYARLLRAFVALTVCASILVFCDWLLQFAGLGMPNLEAILPQAWIYLEYVYVQPLQWDSIWLKPNGLFFLEASHVSQFVAMGLVIELAFFRRPVLISITVAALFLSYGGTGIILLALSIPFLASRLRPSMLIGCAIFAVLALLAAGWVGALETFINRSAEFSQTNSSAYNRFILPAERFVAHLQDDPERLLAGIGAGQMPKAVNNLSQLTFGLLWPPYAKFAVEYGIIAFVFWLVFFCYCSFSSGVPLIVAWIAFLQYQLLNGSLNVPVHTMYCWLLCAGYFIVDHDTRASAPRPFSGPPVRLDRA